MSRLLSMLLTLGILSSLLTSAALAEGPKYTDPKKTDADFAIQGEYQGTLPLSEGDVKFGVQIIALGKGTFQAVAFWSGLPGDGWNGERKLEADGQMKDGKATFAFEQANCTVQNGVFTVVDLDGYEVGKFKRVERKSDTLGKKPPEGAVVLFDGSNADAWENGRTTDDGLLMPGTQSKKKFADHDVHIEFRLPYQPEDRGQGRGNSGIYLQGRYEVQMLDSFGLESKDNECGGLYSVKSPDVNMCFSPLSWQTYDIKYAAAKYDDAGKLEANPRITVMHNGVLIHDNVELPGNRSTTAAPNKPGPELGPVYLQDHGCPVRYRNIWVVEKK